MSRATRIGQTIVRLTVAIAFAAALISSLGGGANAQPMSPGQIKDAFAKGCKEGGNSFVDNPDGSYQCNLKDGSTIKCSASGQCHYIPKAMTHGTGAVSGTIVNTDLAVADEGTRPVKTGGKVIAKRGGAFETRLIEPESTPTS